MILSAIVAAARNNVIGQDNKLPWRLPADMRYFKATTMGHPVIMGRLTYESFGRALSGRTNIVITHRTGYRLPDALVAGSLTEALDQAREKMPDEAFIIGGAQVYKESLPLLDRIYLTRIFEDFEGDARFPDLDPGQWTMTREEQHASDEKNPYPFAFQLWERTTGAQPPEAAAK